MWGDDINSMKFIPSEEVREKMLFLAKKVDYKYYVLLLLGFNTGLRISDLLRLRVRDMQNNPFLVRESKTGKKRYVELPLSIFDEIKGYCERVHKNNRMNYLVYSRYWCKDKSLSRVQAYKVLRSVAGDVGLDGTGTHCMRKSFAYDLFKATKDINVVRDVLNHKYTDTTMRYLFTPDMLDKLFMSFENS
jgi:integrase